MTLVSDRSALPNVKSYLYTFYGAICVVGVVTVYLAILFHGRAALYINFAYSSCKDDMANIVDHYKLKRTGTGDLPTSGWEYETSGPKGFWVAEINEQIVGCIGLGKPLTFALIHRSFFQKYSQIYRRSTAPLMGRCVEW